MRNMVKKDKRTVMICLVKKKLRRFYDVYIKRDPQRIAFYNYLDLGGESLRLDYCLSDHDIVLDVGGFMGDFANAVTSKFDCSVNIFEPVVEYAEAIRRRFFENQKIFVIQAGLGGKDCDELISVEGASSSVIVGERNSGEKEEVKIISIVDYLKSKKYASIGLVKINIEGSEYELMNVLLEHPALIKKIRYFQIQFHSFVPNATIMREKIQNELSKTHKKMWDFPFIWESWEIIES